jgi:hypothetical protein
VEHVRQTTGLGSASVTSPSVGSQSEIS